MSKLNHISFILDGNRRWAKNSGLDIFDAYEIGARNVEKMIDYCHKKGISHASFFAFSTENNERGEREKEAIFKVLKSSLESNLYSIVKRHDIKVSFFGDISKMPKDIYDLMQKIEDKTKNNQGINVGLCINYSGKWDILNAISKIDGGINEKNFEKNFAKYLSFSGFPDPDILIRTGGRNRISNFCLWNLAYSEIFFMKKMWPDFNKKDLSRVITDYNNIERNFGI